MKKKETEEFDSTGDFAASLIQLLLVIAVLLICGFIIFVKFKISDYFTTTDVVEVNAIITDIYRNKVDTDTYQYHIIVDTTKYGQYSIEVSKSNFTKYKLGDTIPIKIKNGEAYVNVNP